MPVIFEDHDPQTLDEAIDVVYTNLDDSERELIKQQENGSVFHHTFGMSMRNGWKLWNNTSPLRKFFEEKYGLGHADDLSAMILDGIVNKVKGEPSDFETMAQVYRDYWTNQNVDPLTQEEINGKG